MPGTPQLADPCAEVQRPLDDCRALVRRGRVCVALDALNELRDAVETHVPPVERAILLALLLDCHLAQGDLEPALTVGAELAAFVTGPGPAGAVAHQALGELASATDEPELALEHYLTVGALTHESNAPPISWAPGAALAMVRVGRRGDALALARGHLAAARERGTAYDVALALRTLAAVDPDAQRLPRLREARALLIHSDAERLRAQIDTDLAGLLVLSGNPTEAVRLLREVEAYAGRRHLWPLQSRARRLLERLGEAPRRVGPEALTVLTAAERRVAMLVVEGLSNRLIAEQLRVSVKAVEGHLSKVYRKLGVASRVGLVSTLAGPSWSRGH